jgi:hypothetical protein
LGHKIDDLEGAALPEPVDAPDPLLDVGDLG